MPLFFTSKFYPMTKIQWEGWGQFSGLEDFLEFAMSEKDHNYNMIHWLNNDYCPIVIWLN